MKQISGTADRILQEIPWSGQGGATSSDLQKKLPDLSTYKISMVISHELNARHTKVEKVKMGDDLYNVYVRIL